MKTIKLMDEEVKLIVHLLKLRVKEVDRIIMSLENPAAEKIELTYLHSALRTLLED